MLTDLRVRDLGVIEDLTLRFGPGMTALTGETGAGKTLLVEALQLVLGGRPPPGLVRAGAAEALVEARFVVGETETRDLWPGPIPAAGRSRAWVDGRMVPVTALAEAGRDLVDIHGQHDQQSLLAPAAQRRALDEFAGTDLGPRRRAVGQVEEIDRSLAALGGDGPQRARELDVLRHQVAEIEAAAHRRPRRGGRAAGRGGAAGRPLRPPPGGRPGPGRAGGRWIGGGGARPGRAGRGGPGRTGGLRRLDGAPAGRPGRAGRRGQRPAGGGGDLGGRPGPPEPRCRPVATGWPTCAASTGGPWPR